MGTGVIGGPLSLKQMKLSLLECWIKLKDRCVEACSSSSSADCENCGGDAGNTADPARSGSLQGDRCSVVSSVSKPSSGTLVSLAGLLNSGSLPSHSSTAPAVSSLELQHIQHIQQARRARTVSGDSSATPRLGGIHSRRVAIGRILDPLQVYDNMNLGRRIDPLWPDPDWRAKGGRNAWNSWIPLENMEGPIVHRWTPCHRDPLNRSHTDKTILLLRLGERYVPIAEQAVLILPEDDRVSHKSVNENEKSSKSGSKSEKENRSISEKDEAWSKSLQSVDSMKSLAGIPSISERDEIVLPGRDMGEVVELRASTLE